MGQLDGVRGRSTGDSEETDLLAACDARRVRWNPSQE